jgi:hypothetical protein
MREARRNRATRRAKHQCTDVAHGLAHGVQAPATVAPIAGTCDGGLWLVAVVHEVIADRQRAGRRDRGVRRGRRAGVRAGLGGPDAALLQRRVPPHLLGRVSSMDFFVSLALMPVSMALAGPVGEAIGIPLTFVLAGAIPVFLAVAAILGRRLWRDELDHPLDATPGHG